MSTTEETVQNEPAIGKGAFAAARASISAQSSDQGGKEDEPSTDDTPVPEKPAEDTAKVADQPPETTEEPTDALLTQDELAALPPKERAKAEKWQAKLTRQAQSLSERSKQFDEWTPLIEALRTNPDATLERLAKERGLTIAKPGQDTTVESDDLPPELAFLKPVLEAREKRIEAKIRAELAPVKEAQEHASLEAVARETEATMERFTAKYPGWKKHEGRMMELAQTFVPTQGKMTDFEYMDVLHTLATKDISEAEKTKKVVEKINKAAQSVEPTTPGVSENRVEHVMPSGLSDSKDRWKAAVAAAKQGHRWTT